MLQQTTEENTSERAQRCPILVAYMARFRAGISNSDLKVSAVYIYIMPIYTHTNMVAI